MKLLCLSIGILLCPVILHGAQTPVVQIYEFNGSERILLDSTPNADLLIPASQDNVEERQLVLQCRAPYPIQWTYSGDGIPEYTANTSRTVKPHEFIATAEILRLAEHHTGSYTCKSLHNSKWAVSYFLYVTGDKLFTANGGDLIEFADGDESVRIPCSVSNPHIRVTLQKLIDGYVHCPLNDTIKFDNKKGFVLTITDAYQPEGNYLCIGSYRGEYKFAEYLVLPSKPAQAYVAYPKLGDIPNSPVIENPCDSFPCGRYAYCNKNATDHPVCKCERSFNGDPYIKCEPQCLVNDDCPSNRACKDYACEDPCLSACEATSEVSVKSCKVVNHTSICNFNHCNPSPCGLYSKCKDLKEKANCSCLPGHIGKPPNCNPIQDSNQTIKALSDSSMSLKSSQAVNPVLFQSMRNPDASMANVVPEISIADLHPEVSVAKIHPELSVLKIHPEFSLFKFHPEVEVAKVQPEGSEDEGDAAPSGTNCTEQHDCPVTLRCIEHKCKDPCHPNPCSRSSMCEVASHEAICACAPGLTKVGQHCLPSNCRSQSDCPENKACLRNKCMNPCNGYCGPNSECTVQLHLARCACAEGFERNSLHGCTPAKSNMKMKAAVPTSPMEVKLETPAPTPTIIQKVFKSLNCNLRGLQVFVLELFVCF